MPREWDQGRRRADRGLVGIPMPAGNSRLYETLGAPENSPRFKGLGAEASGYAWVIARELRESGLSSVQAEHASTT